MHEIKYLHDSFKSNLWVFSMSFISLHCKFFFSFILIMNKVKHSLIECKEADWWWNPKREVITNCVKREIVFSQALERVKITGEE